MNPEGWRRRLVSPPGAPASIAGGISFRLLFCHCHFTDHRPLITVLLPHRRTAALTH
jgi:hypothetical protein